MAVYEAGHDQPIRIGDSVNASILRLQIIISAKILDLAILDDEQAVLYEPDALFLIAVDRVFNEIDKCLPYGVGLLGSAGS